MLAASAPAGRWTLTGPSGTSAPRVPVVRVGRPSYRVAAAGPGSLRFDGGLLTPLSFVVSVVTWLVALALLIGDDLGRPRRRVRLRRRRSAEDGSTAEGSPAGAAGAPAAAEDRVASAGVSPTRPARLVGVSRVQ